MRKKVLITAGSTIVPIDKVRLISNVFSGKTGTGIAKYFRKQGNDVTLVTSNPKLLDGYRGESIRTISYRTFEDLKVFMEAEIRTGGYDVIVHSAAVSDYRVEGVYLLMEIDEDFAPNFILERLDSTKKISSRHDNLYLRLVPTEKLVDLIREPWGFKGKLVKFKLEVGITDEELIEIGKKSRAASDADLIVVNCLEWSGQYAYILDENGKSEKTSRRKLAENLYRKLK